MKRQREKEKRNILTMPKCQYHYPNCQKTAQFQHILKLGAVKIDKGWICGNCKEHLEKNQAK